MFFHSLGQMLKYASILGYLSFFNSYGEICASSENPEDKQKPVTLSALYLGDVVGCFHGGLRNGATYLGLFDFSAEINTLSLGMWNGGNVLIDVQNTHNGTPSSDMVGDLQVFDNIENGDHTYLYQLWYRQQLGNFWFLGGLHDLNSEFLMSDYACEYLNSSFGIMPVTSLNTPVSIFPKTALSILAGYDSDRFSFKTGIYEGDPGDLEEDPYNLDLSFNYKQGLFLITEMGFHHNWLKDREGIIKIGTSFHTADHASVFDSCRYYKSNYNIYLIADQKIQHQNNDPSRGLGLLVQLGLAPSNRNMNDLFLALGMNYTGIFEKRKSDILGLAMAYASISNPCHEYDNSTMRPAETVFELSYKAFFFKHFFLQPNFQYIINPGINPETEDAGVAILRIGITY